MDVIIIYIINILLLIRKFLFSLGINFASDLYILLRIIEISKKIHGTFSLRSLTCA